MAYACRPRLPGALLFSLTLWGAYLMRRQGDAVKNKSRAISLWQGAIPLLTKKQIDVAFALQTEIADTSVALSEDIGDDALVSAIEAHQMAGRHARRLGNENIGRRPSKNSVTPLLKGRTRARRISSAQSRPMTMR
jgi:hypothetical protein